MALTVLLGGARSGKSGLAVILAARQTPVVFLATAEAKDAEMADRIARHRAERPAGWLTIEEPLELEHTISTLDPGCCLIVDCLSLWVANSLAVVPSEQIAQQAQSAALVSARRAGPTFAVTNEVGLGLVPGTPVGRAYRDLLGTVNAAWVAAAERAFLVVAGRLLGLSPIELVLETDGS